MANASADRRALQHCLDNWHAHAPKPSVERMGCLGVALLGLAFGVIALLAIVMWAGLARWYLEEHRDHAADSAAHVEGAQGAEGEAGREGQDVGHGVNGAVAHGGGA